MNKTARERARLYRLRKGATIKEKERERSTRRRQQKKSGSQKAKEKAQSKKRSRSYRERKRRNREADSVTTNFTPKVSKDDSSKAYKTPGAKTKAKNKLIVLLPKSPRKRIAVVRSLADDYLEENELKKEKISRLKLEEVTLQHVQEFYERDDNSRWTPGRKDFVKIIGDDGEKEAVQKRYLICTLKELYELFKLEYLNDNIGFSKFADMRPKYICTRYKSFSPLALY